MHRDRYSVVRLDHHVVSQDSPYNLDPEQPELMDDFTAAMLKKEGKEWGDLETEIVEASFVQVGYRNIFCILHRYVFARQAISGVFVSIVVLPPSGLKCRAIIPQIFCWCDRPHTHHNEQHYNQLVTTKR